MVPLRRHFLERGPLLFLDDPVDQLAAVPLDRQRAERVDADPVAEHLETDLPFDEDSAEQASQSCDDLLLRHKVLDVSAAFCEQVVDLGACDRLGFRPERHQLLIDLGAELVLVPFGLRREQGAQEPRRQAAYKLARQRRVREVVDRSPERAQVRQCERGDLVRGVQVFLSPALGRRRPKRRLAGGAFVELFEVRRQDRLPIVAVSETGAPAPSRRVATDRATAVA